MMGILNKIWVRVTLMLLVLITITGFFFLIQNTEIYTTTEAGSVEANSPTPTFSEEQRNQYNMYRRLGYEPQEALYMITQNTDNNNDLISDDIDRESKIPEIVWDILAVIFWLVILPYPVYFLGRYIYHKYIFYTDPSRILSKIQASIETNQKQYAEILTKYDVNEASSSMGAFIKEIMETDIQLVNQIRSTKIKERFNKKKLRELSVYISDYVKLQAKLVNSPDWREDGSDYKKNTDYLEMQEILRAIS